MAGGALTFAEVLREEYEYLHGESPRPRAHIELRHLREVSSLIQRIKVAPENGPGRHSLLARYCKPALTGHSHDEVVKGFRMLASSVEVEASDGSMTLFEALLRDREIMPRLRNLEMLRRLVSVPHARCLVFSDAASARTVASNAELRDVFRATSAGVRLLFAEHPEVFERFPPLFATIADDERLDKLLRQSKEARASLTEAFAEPADPRPWYAQIWARVLNYPVQDVRWRLSCDAAAILNRLDGSNAQSVYERRAIPSDDLRMFNSMLLEVAFSECFTDSYDVRSMNTAFHGRGLAALCLSGGGIRSATFNLGIVQGLADHGLLQRFHYLSTVSGGGYVGSWLSSWIRRHNEGAPGVCNDLSAPPADPEDPEVRPIRHLRAYSSYLNPNASLFSTDTLAIVAIYVRNLLLNWTILIPFFAAILMVPRLVERIIFGAWARDAASNGAGLAAGVLGLAALISVAMLRPRSDQRSGRERSDEELRRDRRRTGIWLIPMFGAAFAFNAYWASLRSGRLGDTLIVDGPAIPIALMLASGLAGTIFASRRVGAYAAGMTRIERIRSFFKLFFDRRQLPAAIGEILATMAAGLITGLLLRLSYAAFFPAELLGQMRQDLFLEQYICFGVPLFLAIFFVEATILVGITTTSTSDHDREWWARSAGLMFIFALTYLAATSIVTFAPIGIVQFGTIVGSLGGVSAVASWVLGRADKLKKAGGDRTKSAAAMAAALKIAAAITIVILLAGIVIGTTAILERVHPVDGGPDLIFGAKAAKFAGVHLMLLRAMPLRALFIFLLSGFAIAGVVSVLLDVNVYSMHGMYRNRLIRAYLGASRWFRRPDAFTGFDPQDNLDMFELRPEALWTSSFIDFEAFARKLSEHEHLVTQLPIRERLAAYVRKAPNAPSSDEMRSEVVRVLNERMVTHDLEYNVEAPHRQEVFAANRAYLEREYAGLMAEVPSDAHAKPTDKRSRPPIHVLNAALNLVGGDNLAWQERKADSFTITPMHAGNRRLGYRDSFDYGEHISLGTALAVSGAAVSPNMGYHSTPAVTFLMTFFNARLGWWLGNPAQPFYDRPGPRTTLDNLVDEAFGRTNEKSPWVFLSDGGHFDNLGLYEMVRRRCHFIVASDATADGKYAFADLGNAVRKIRIDLGIPITFRTAYVPPEPGQTQGKYFAVGVIHYGDVDDVKPQHAYGYLLYVKPAVYSDCPADVRNYKTENDSFPHEPTVDQFFGESQFESYRALGRHIVGRICGDEMGKPPTAPPSVGAFISNALADVAAQTALPAT